MDDDQQFCLRWNNHQSTLISVFDTLLENETLVDCTLAAEGKYLKAHKVVLSACSPYFATLLQEQYDKHPIFILKDVKYQELRAMMDYMYRGEVNISQDQLAALLKAAESLQIKGLSDNRTAGSSGIPPKPDHHRGLTVPSASGKLSGSYTLEQTKRARIGGGASAGLDTQDILSGSREGSSSPSRRRRKVRRRSIENAMADVHDNSNSSQIQSSQTALLHQQQQQTNASLAGVGAITAAASALAAQIPVSASAAAAALPTGSTGGGAGAATSSAAGGSQGAPTQQQTASGVTKKTESVKGTSDAINAENIQGGVAGVVADEQEMERAAVAPKSEKQNHHHKQKGGAAAATGGKDTASAASSELVIEPKSEYDDEGNDEPVEDLTLDDEGMGMDDLDHNAGTSQGGEGSSQGYAPWQHDRSQDELLLATQEAQQRDPQDMKYDFQSSMVIGNNELGIGSMDRFPCAVCGKSYLRKRHLQRHMRDECIGIPPRFSCDFCPSRFRRKYHMVRHLISKHGIPPAIAQQTTGGGLRGVPGLSSGEDSPIPENLSLKKEKLQLENVLSPVNGGAAAAAAGDGSENGGGMADGGNGSINGTLGTSPLPTMPPLPLPTYGLTGAITAISTAAALLEENSVSITGNIKHGVAVSEHDDDTENGGGGHGDMAEDGAIGGGVGCGVGGGGVGGGAGVANIKAEPMALNKAYSQADDDWKMKLSLQFISNSLLKERLMNSMPFAYNNN